MPAVSEEEFQNIKAIGKAGLRAKTIALCRIVKGDVTKALECGVWGVSISIPIGYLQAGGKDHLRGDRVDPVCTPAGLLRGPEPL